MLAPDTRVTLVEALRPPPGHSVDFAVGTTFTLDLQALLTAPAAFALIEAIEREPAEGDAPLELLDSIRRHADRLLIFCQAGQTSVPAQWRLLPYLERAVVPVTAPGGGIFHPKVWVIRYRDLHDGSLRHRLLCASRNVTFDRSWDTMLALDESDGDTALPLGADVASFLRALPAMAVEPIDAETEGRLEGVAASVEGVAFAAPDGVSDGRFLPLGLGVDAPSWPFEASCQRLVVMSPFLDRALIERLPRASEQSAIISRPEALNAVGSGPLSRFTDTFVVTPDAALSADASAAIDQTNPGNAAASPSGGPSGSVALDPRWPLSGLHAKLYIVEESGHPAEARVLTGSANATSAAFDRNVEAMVELRGSPCMLGVQALLGDGNGGEVSLRTLLEPYSVPDNPDDAVEGEPESALDRARRALAACSLAATVDALPQASRGDGAAERYRIRYQTVRAPSGLPPGVFLECWPVTRPAAWARPPAIAEDGRLWVEFESEFEHLTAFLAVRLRDAEGETEFLMPARVSGMPEDRSARLLHSLLGTAARLLAYLLFLLSDHDSDLWSVGEALEEAQREDFDFRAAIGLPLLEAMLDAVHRDPRRLQHVQRIVEELRSSPTTRDLFPPSFDEVWSAVWAAANEGAT